MNTPAKLCGIGLRAPHCQQLLGNTQPISHLEVLADNYFTSGGFHLKQLDQICENYPISAHCVGLSIGSIDPPDTNYIKQLKAFMQRYQPATISDHLCWTSYKQQQFHDLLPLPYTKECIEHLTNKLDAIQNALGTELIIENVSSYLEFPENEVSEAEFLQQLIAKSGCKLLLDVNNVYVSAQNNKFCAKGFLNTLPKDAVAYFHLAGYEVKDTYLLDAHNSAVSDPVWHLFETTLQRFGAKPTVIEWDSNIPTLGILMQEAEKAQSYLGRYTPNQDKNQAQRLSTQQSGTQA